MADYGPVKIRTGNINDLIDIYKQSYKNIVTTITDATEAGKIQKARVMAQINAELTRLGVDVDAWVKKEIPQYYLDGSNLALQDLRAMGVDISSSSMAVVNREAIKALTDEVSLAFAEGIQGISRNARRVITDAQKQQINATIAEGKIQGQTLKNIAAGVKQDLAQNGLSVLVDKGGKRWTFDTYSEMLVRTKGVEARNQGLANRMLQNGYDLVQVTDHRSKHKVCQRWEGMILSLTGLTPVGTELPGGYVVDGTYEEARASGLFHPNCKHAINAIHPELAAKTKAYNNPFNYRRPIDELAPAPSRTALKKLADKPVTSTVYHGAGGNAIPGNDMFGEAFYVSRDKSVAAQFGPNVTKSKMTVKPSDLLVVPSQEKYDELVKAILKKYPGELQTSFPKFVKDLGYKAVEASPGFDPLGGIGIFDKSILH